MKKKQAAGSLFEELVNILATLRGPEGCPWDKDQGEKSIRDFFLEEVFEAVEAIDKGDPDNLAEELGDVLMEVVFLSRLYEEKGFFTIADVLAGINRKMILRHPHVFGEKRAMTAVKVLDAWYKQKSSEKKQTFPFEEAGAAAPALMVSYLIGRRVSAMGFDWPSPKGALEKVIEEIGELKRALSRSSQRHVEEEIGDLYFALANLSRKLRINPEVALRRANRKFINRFRAMEEALKSSGRTPAEASLKEMDRIWNGLKSREKPGKSRGSPKGRKIVSSR